SLSSASGYSDTNITIYANCSDTGSNVSNVTVSVYYPNSTWINYSMASLNETSRYTKSYRPNIVGAYNFSFYCQDYYGNIASNETTGLQFTSSTRPPPSGGGGGGTSTVTYEQKSLGILSAGSSKAVTFTKSATLAVTEITVTVKNRVTNAKIKIDLGSLPSGASKPSTKGSVYKYIEITKTGMADDDIEKAVIKFKVKKSWLTDKGYGRDTVALHRYHENKWNKLETTRYSEDATCYHYSAESPGFSTFAITVEKATAKTAKTKATIKKVLEEEESEAEESVTTEEHPAEEEPPAEALPERKKEELSNTALIITLIAVIIILVIISYFVQKKKQKKKKEYKKEKKKKHKRKG
ncbi:MAG TPA: PGF-pre-PGF domain-containing protein, partial [Candidatus Woesearchaeota archaeon]|nr:PGF-pre-PGF domain-containing protein [Candidatus Woesearchaeota archaeon]